MSKRCSIIIRTRNEERWISLCLSAVFKQEYKNFEVILVDNESTDKTVEKAKKFPITKIATCTDYLPGKALNIGIRESSGDYIICLSGHCVPVNEHWLGNLVKELDENPEVAGAYGRQEPLAFSGDLDKRDLLLSFGLDRRVQVKDSFFHNANSIIRRSLWDKEPFSEDATNIEDRIWAEQMIQSGYQLVYTPDASVYHHHGIHQHSGKQNQRATNIVRILESLAIDHRGGLLDIEHHDIACIIPIRGPVAELAGRPVMQYTIEHALQSKYVNTVIVSTDNEETAEMARELGAKVPFIRPPSLSEEYISLEQVYQYSLEQLEDQGIYPDILITLEITFPFRPSGLIDNLIERLVLEDLDSLVAVKRESRDLWKASDAGQIERLDVSYSPRQFKEMAFIGLKGLGSATRAEFLRRGQLLGTNVGLLEVQSPYAPFEVRSPEDFEVAEHFFEIWKEQNEKETGYISHRHHSD